MEKSIEARCILDILGSPKEFIEKKLKEHVEKVRESVEIIEEDFAPAQEKDDMFTTFVELSLRFKDIQQLLDFCFESMPSSIEVMEPEQLVLKAPGLNTFLNDFQAKMHHADMMLKELTAQKKLLDVNAVNTMHNFIVYACKQKPLTMQELSRTVGLKEENLEKFVQNLVEKNKLKKEGDKYSA